MSKLLVLLVITASVLVYFGLRLSPAFGTAAWVVSALLLGLLFVYPLTWRWRESDALPAKLIRWAIYFDMGFISLLVSLLILRDILLLPFTWWKPELTEAFFGVGASTALIVLSIVGLIFGLIRALSGPRVKRVDVTLPQLPAALEGFKIAQISDLHAGPTISRAYVENVVKKVKELGADVVVMTGDIADGDVAMFRSAVEPLRELSQGTPLYYVTGNHEYYWNAPSWIRVFEALGARALMNSSEIIERGGARLLMAGVIDPTARMERPDARPDARAAMGTQSADVRVLLSHHPGIARTAAEIGYDLQLSGHTHAGQFFPWTLVVPRVHEFSNGLEACGKMWVYVNPGTGSWGPPIRIGTTPEITLLRMIRGAAAGTA